MKLSKMNGVNRLLILLYGKPLIGKTVLASQFPSPAFIELDGKLASVVSSRSICDEKFDFDSFFIDESETTDPDFLELCGKGFSKQSAWIKARKLTEVLLDKLPQDSTLVIDSLTKLAEHLVHYIEVLSNHKPIQIQDWNLFTMYISEYIDLLRSARAKCNVIIIGHEEYVRDDTTGGIERLLYLPTRQKYRIPALADEYWLLQSDQKLEQGKRVNRRVLQVVPDRQTPCGSSLWMPNIDNPTYDKVKSYLEKGLGRTLPEPTWTPK